MITCAKSVPQKSSIGMNLSRESKPLEKENWAAVVDTVGGDTLATVIAQTQAGGYRCRLW